MHPKEVLEYTKYSHYTKWECTYFSASIWKVSFENWLCVPDMCFVVLNCAVAHANKSLAFHTLSHCVAMINVTVHMVYDISQHFQMSPQRR